VTCGGGYARSVDPGHCWLDHMQRRLFSVGFPRCLCRPVPAHAECGTRSAASATLTGLQGAHVTRAAPARRLFSIRGIELPCHDRLSGPLYRPAVVNAFGSRRLPLVSHHLQWPVTLQSTFPRPSSCCWFPSTLTVDCSALPPPNSSVSEPLSTTAGATTIGRRRPEARSAASSAVVDTELNRHQFRTTAKRARSIS